MGFTFMLRDRPVLNVYFSSPLPAASRDSIQFHMVSYCSAIKCKDFDLLKMNLAKQMREGHVRGFHIWIVKQNNYYITVLQCEEIK